MIDKKAALEHIDYVLMMDAALSRGEDDASAERRREIWATKKCVFDSVFERLCPKDSPHWQQFMEAEWSVEKRGILTVMRAEYENGWLQTFTELVHQGTLSDFLGMADRLLSEGLKDAAAMYAGGALENHLRNLCTKMKIDLTYKDNKGVDHPKMIDRMNNDLKDRAYGPVHHKQIIAWAAIRNHAAHAEYNKYDAPTVAMMVEGVQHFITSYPA